MKSRQSGRRNRQRSNVRRSRALNRGILGTLYQQQENLTYVSILVVDPEDPDTSHLSAVPAGNKAVYISSRRLGDREVVYGSLLHAIDEAVRPIYQSQRLTLDLRKAIPPDAWPSVISEKLGDGVASYTLPPGGYADAILRRQEEILKDALLLSGIHVRTLLEDFSGQGNVLVPVYNYESKPAGHVSVAQVFNTLGHYRYCAISGESVHDVFSREGQLGPDELAGSEMKVQELFNAVFEFISRIRVRDFVGVLRGRLESLSINSDRKDVIFAVQNVGGIAQILHERFAASGDIPEFMQFLTKHPPLTAREERALRDARARGESTVCMVRAGGLPGFKIGQTLSARKIEMHITINGNKEVVEFGWEEFFRELVRAHGDEPLVPGDVLDKRFQHLEFSATANQSSASAHSPGNTI